MSRLEELIQVLCPDGVEYRNLGDIGRVAMCKRIMKAETVSDGDIPFYKIGTFGKAPNAYISVETYERYKRNYSFPRKGDVLISAAGTIGRTVIYDGEAAYYQDSNIVWLEHDESQVINKYLYYCYQLSPWCISTGGTIARLYNDNIAKAEIPVPPLPIQQEIVRILDTFTALEAELEAELEKRKKQYGYYRDALLASDNDLPMVTLGQIFQLKAGKFIQATHISEVKDNEHAFPCYGGNGLRGFVKNYNQNASNVLIGRQGALCGNIKRVSGRYYATEHAVVVSAKNAVNIDWAFHMLTSMNLNQYKSKSAQPGLSVEKLEQLVVPLPPLAKQERIAAILDRFDALVNDITQGLPAEIAARRKQYEYYRDKLLTFKRKEAAV